MNCCKGSWWTSEGARQWDKYRLYSNTNSYPCWLYALKNRFLLNTANEVKEKVQFPTFNNLHEWRKLYQECVQCFAENAFMSVLLKLQLFKSYNLSIIF